MRDFEMDIKDGPDDACTTHISIPFNYSNLLLHLTVSVCVAICWARNGSRPEPFDFVDISTSRDEIWLDVRQMARSFHF